MSNFFGFEDHFNQCYTVINIDKIVLITKDIVTKYSKTEIKILMYVEFGKDVKIYHLTEEQYYKLNDIIKMKVLC